MSKITWVHISDVQFRARPSFDEQVIRDTLLLDIKTQKGQGLQPDFIVVTGDVAYSGSADEYALAQVFFNDLLGMTGLGKDRLFVVPGNHDVDRSAISVLAATAASNLDSRYAVTQLLMDPEGRSLMTRPLGNFFRFANRYLGKSCLTREKFFYVKDFAVADTRLAILGLNSAWASWSDSDLGNLILGEPQVRQALASAGDADLKIALLHHPFEWFKEFDRLDAEALLLRECSFVLSGHLSSQVTARIPSGNEVIFVHAGFGGRAAARGRDAESTYNIVQLDTAARMGEIHLRRFSDSGGGFWTNDALTYREASDGIYHFELPFRERQPPKSVEVGSEPPSISEFWIRLLGLRNFRCFDNQVFGLSQDFTLLIGNNSSGKTAVLEALAIVAGSLFLGIDGVSSPSIDPDHVRLVAYRHGEEVTVEPQHPVHIRCEAQWGSQPIKWSRTLERQRVRQSPEDVNDILALGQTLQSLVSEGREVVLPLIAYYSTGRLWRSPQAPPIDRDRSGSRFSGYDNCLDPASHVSGLTSWLKNQELIALQEKKPRLVYTAVKEAITTYIENLRDISYDVGDNEVYVDFDDGEHLPLRMLSEGVRNVLGMVADIAHRAAILNPHFGKNVAKRTPGIVLIDEIDLHLHPKWQQTVVADLHRAFPRIQFVATTHSPLIVGGLLPEQIIVLQRDEEHRNKVVVTRPEEPLKGWRADQILTSSAFRLTSSRELETQELMSTYSSLSAREDLSGEEEEQLRIVAAKLGLQLPTAGEREDAREAYKMIQQTFLHKWQERSQEERDRLWREVWSQLLESSTGTRGPE